jgi:hypothetical protein
LNELFEKKMNGNGARDAPEARMGQRPCTWWFQDPKAGLPAPKVAQNMFLWITGNDGEVKAIEKPNIERQIQVQPIHSADETGQSSIVTEIEYDLRLC